MDTSIRSEAHWASGNSRKRIHKKKTINYEVTLVTPIREKTGAQGLIVRPLASS